MKLFCSLIATIVISQYCNAAPQRLGGLDSEVELVPATNTNERDPESGFPLRGNGGSSGNGFPVIIVRTSSAGRNPLHTLLNDFFGKSGSTDEEKTDNEEEDIPEIPLSNFPDLSSILGISNKDTNEGDVNTDENVFPDFTSIFSKAGATDNEKKCGLLCTLFKNFDTQLKTIEEEVREIRDKEREKENEIDQGDEEENSGPVNEYSEEVLPDGTIVRTNKTYSTSEDGSSFFSFQSTSFNSFGDSTDTKTEEEIDDDEGKDVADDTVSDNDSPTKEYEDVEEEREEMEDKDISETIKKENKRTARSPNDPFDQQQEDVSAFLLKGTKPLKQQKDLLSSLNPQDNEISNNPLRTRGGIPVYPPVSLEGDTLVNDLLLDNGRRGGLIRLEPDAELLKQEATEF